MHKRITYKTPHSEDNFFFMRNLQVRRIDKLASCSKYKVNPIQYLRNWYS
jgi:hypothetical protein